jgi:hypothetical protein
MKNKDWLAPEFRGWMPCVWLAKLKAFRADDLKAPAIVDNTLDRQLDKYRALPRYFSSTRYLKQHDRAVWNGTDPLMRFFAGALILELKKYEIPMYVHTAYRSPLLQAELERKGMSQIRTQGPHQRGCAVDIVHAEYHWSPDGVFWDFVGEVGVRLIKKRSLPIEWGGDFRSLYDPAHWQLEYWKEAPAFGFDSPYFLPDGEVETKTPTALKEENISYGYESKRSTIKRLRSR